MASPVVQRLRPVTLPQSAPQRAVADPRVDCTLLDLVRAIGEVTEDEQEIVATVVDLLRTGRVRLCGALRDET